MIKGNLFVTTSWDDGHILDLIIADMLSEYGVQGTFYIPKVRHSKSLEMADIKELSRNFEIGAHGLTDVGLTDISLFEAKREVEGSKEYLETLLGREITMFCYPRGQYNSQVKNIVKDAGFLAARTIRANHFALPTDPFEWEVTMFASRGSPLETLKIYSRNPFRMGYRSLVDWAERAKRLFDEALKVGGVYHIWGHPGSIEQNKLREVLEYISHRPKVQYVTNSAVFTWKN